MKNNTLTVSDEVKRRALPWALASGAFNAVFALWVFSGSVFVLFMRELGLPASEIGGLLSLFPFCGLLALFFAPAAARMGRKRVYLIFYGVRKLVIAMLLLLPWIITVRGMTAAKVFLVTIIVVFAVLRALAETASYPWLQEYVPNSVRGKFNAWISVIGLLASGVALWVASVVIDHGTGVGRYLILIGAGAFLGIIGVLLMAFVPGGAPINEPKEGPGYGAKMIVALLDRNFVYYLLAFAGGVVGLALLTSFLPLFICDHLGMKAKMVMRLDLVAMICGAVASLGLGWLSDRVGSRPVLMPTAALLSVIPLCLIMIAMRTSAPLVLLFGLYALFGVAQNGQVLVSSRLLYNGVTPSEDNTAYMAVYYAWMGIVGGVRLCWGDLF